MNKKKLIAGVMSLAIAFSSLSAFSAASVTSFAEGPVAEEPVGSTDDDTVTYPIEAEVDGGQYSVYEDHAILSKCSDSYVGDFVIPAEVQGVPITRIGERVFGFQKQIVSVTIPATVTEIGGHLAGYSTLQKYIVDENNKTFCSVDGVVFTKDMKTLVAYPTSYYTKTYTVPDGVETIGDGAAYNSDIESLILSDSVTRVDDFAFTYCKKLKSIKFTNSLKFIGYSGFGNCASLESADVPASVETIDTNAFGYCAALKTLTINNPNCTISDFKPNDTVVIRGYEGSTAQAYAEKNELTFEALGGEPAIAVTTASTTAATTTTTTQTAVTTTTATVKSAETIDLKFGFAEPIVKVIDAKPYDIKISGIYSVSGEKVLDETADSAKIAEIKNGVVAAVSQTVMNNNNITPDNYAAFSNDIRQAALEYFNKNYAVNTGYTLTSLSIVNFTLKEKAASVVTGATTATATTAATTTTTTVAETSAANTTTTETATTTLSSSNMTSATAATSTASAATTSAATAATSTTTEASTTASATSTATVTTEVSAKDFVGTWKVSGVRDKDGKYSDITGNDSIKIIFNDGGTGTATFNGGKKVYDINWKIKDNLIVITNQDESDTSIIDLNIENAGQLSYFDEEDSESTYFSKDSSKLGDANEDGSIDAKDASFILAAYAKASTGSADGLSDTQRSAADVNADGKVDAKDASFILAYYSYLSTGGKDSLEAFLKK
ncbi:MAG: leucine-rich repeat protein [Ruminococcus sp.]|nr:leucine-rich repeat protein [Ruminococcus sp.]